MWHREEVEGWRRQWEGREGGKERGRGKTNKCEGMENRASKTKVKGGEGDNGERGKGREENEGREMEMVRREGGK